MPIVKKILDEDKNIDVPCELLKGKRHLTSQEIYLLIQNRNTAEDWQNIWVSELDGEFNPNQIIQCRFTGFVVIGALHKATLKYHDLEVMVGIFNSLLENVVIDDDCSITNVSYLANYRIGKRVILFNIQEMSCTLHSKFGEGLVKENESESNRIWISVGNENGNRSVLPFTDMITADAYLWSRYREDKLLMQRFIELTEFGKSRENNTYGIVEDDAVIKSSAIIKDVKVGKNAYIKGALKLKNLTVLSSPDEQSQIGEGVEMVNGIMGYGCRVFYQAIAVRFVIGRNCQLKYGARLLNSVLGDNSTVSCCELLNNLIFPFHEQHHNSSFLIASTVMGQSNIASAATIGSNHNSRSPDCEMIAGRGFWPGLCSDLKFDSKFASFVLISKGSYANELNITYPFSLVAPADESGKIHIIPAYWFLYNMFAIIRNKSKFTARDKRFIKVQNIETNPFAPDTMQEIIVALERIIELTKSYLKSDEADCEKNTISNSNPELLQKFRKLASSCADSKLHQIAKDYLHQNPNSNYLLFDETSQKKYGALIFKPAQAYREYRRILKYFIAQSFLIWADENKIEKLSAQDIKHIQKIPLYKTWINAGGQIIPEEKINELFELIKTNKINDWQEVHNFYDECQKHYTEYKVRYAIFLIEYVYGLSIKKFSKEFCLNILHDVIHVCQSMLDAAYKTREKDFQDYFRTITFRNEEEKKAVLGTIEDNSFLKNLTSETKTFISKFKILVSNFINEEDKENEV